MTTKLSSFRIWLIWILAASFFFLEYFARVAPSVMVPELMRYFRVTALNLGALSAFFYYAYIGMQIPVGTLFDRFGTRFLLTITALLCGISCFLLTFTHSIVLAEASRFLMGFAAAFAFVGALKVASMWFPAEKFGLLAGSTQALGMLGAAVGVGPVSILVINYGWRPTMWLIGCALLILALLIGLFLIDKKVAKIQLVTKKITNIVHKKPTIIGALKQVLPNPQLWINGVMTGFLYAPTAAFAELWGSSYLHRIYNIKETIAATAVSMIFIGWAIGGPLSGWFSDHIKRRKPIVIFSIIASGVLMSCILYLPNLSITALYILLFMYGFCNIGVAISYVIAKENYHPSVSGTAMSFTNMASIAVGAFFQPIIGGLLDLHWNHVYVHGIPYYSINDYRSAMVALPACFIVSLIAGLMLKESYIKH